jgi:hypothetical protein
VINNFASATDLKEKKAKQPMNPNYQRKQDYSGGSRGALYLQQYNNSDGILEDVQVVGQQQEQLSSAEPRDIHTAEKPP